MTCLEICLTLERDRSTIPLMQGVEKKRERSFTEWWKKIVTLMHMNSSLHNCAALQYLSGEAFVFVI